MFNVMKRFHNSTCFIYSTLHHRCYYENVNWVCPVTNLLCLWMHFLIQLS